MRKPKYGSLVLTNKGNAGIVVDDTKFPKLQVKLGTRIFEITERSVQCLSHTSNKVFRVEFTFDSKDYTEFVDVETNVELNEISDLIYNKLELTYPNLTINSIKTV
jgi:hypothetical protein